MCRGNELLNIKDLLKIMNKSEDIYTYNSLLGIMEVVKEVPSNIDSEFANMLWLIKLELSGFQD